MDDCKRCGHKKKSHEWRPYGANRKALRCHKKDCDCWGYQEDAIQGLDEGGGKNNG